MLQCVAGISVPVYARVSNQPTKVSQQCESLEGRSGGDFCSNHAVMAKALNLDTGSTAGWELETVQGSIHCTVYSTSAVACR